MVKRLSKQHFFFYRKMAFICEVCGVTFVYKHHLNRHTREKHGDVTKHACEDCGKTFARRENLLVHRVRHETPGTSTTRSSKQVACDVCHKTFCQRSNMLRHRLMHETAGPSTETPDKDHSCHVCSKTFSRRDNMLQHKKYTLRQDPRLFIVISATESLKACTAWRNTKPFVIKKDL